MSKFMIIFGVAALLGLALAQNSDIDRGQEIIGPIEWNCTQNGAFAYPECDKYVDCWEGQAMLGQCTDLMLFDLSYYGCNYAVNVDCGDRSRPTNVPSTVTAFPTTTTSNVSTTTTEGPSEEFDCLGDGVFQHDERCEYYWECYAGVAKLVHCRDDYLFDLVYMGCNFPEQTHCQDRTRPPGVPGTVYPPISTVPTNTPSSTISPTKPTDSTSAEPEPTIGTGSTTTSDPSVPTTTTTAAPTTVTTQEPGSFECPEPNGTFPDPADCSGFYQCSMDIPYHQICPENLYFNPDSETCDFKENVDCQV